jgi:hypothetical protein
VEIGPPSRAETWRTWFETFVLRGNNGNEEEKTGTLTLLSSDLQTSLAQIALYNVGIFGLEGSWPGDPAPSGRLTAHLYCERMNLMPMKGLL